MRMTTFGIIRSKSKRIKLLKRVKLIIVSMIVYHYVRVLPEIRVSVYGIDVESNGCPLRHDVASDVRVLIQHPPQSTHWGKQPQALLNAVLEINKLLHVIAER